MQTSEVDILLPFYETVATLKCKALNKNKEKIKIIYHDVDENMVKKDCLNCTGMHPEKSGPRYQWKYSKEMGHLHENPSHQFIKSTRDGKNASVSEASNESSNPF